MATSATPPYQGHVVSIDLATGRIVHVWNSLCSDRRTLIQPSSCQESDSAIWARAGVVVEPGTGKLLVATGNGAWDGKTSWGDSVLELSPTAGALLQNWTPGDQSDLNTGDVDLGSTAPALLGDNLAVQSGKDGKLRLLDLAKLNGKGGAGPVTGGELQTLPTPSGGGLFSAPAVWRHNGRTWLFVSDFGATAAYVLDGRRLSRVWHVSAAGTSPVVAGGLLYVYDPAGTLDRLRIGVREAARCVRRRPWALEQPDRHGRPHRTSDRRCERPSPVRHARHLARSVLIV